MGISVEVIAAIIRGLLTALGGAASSDVFKRLTDHLFKREPERAPINIEFRDTDAPAVVGQILYPVASRFKLVKQPLGLSVERRADPEVIGKTEKTRNGMDRLEGNFTRPRQVRPGSLLISALGTGHRQATSAYDL